MKKSSEKMIAAILVVAIIATVGSFFLGRHSAAPAPVPTSPSESSVDSEGRRFMGNNYWFDLSERTIIKKPMDEGPETIEYKFDCRYIEYVGTYGDCTRAVFSIDDGELWEFRLNGENLSYNVYER